MFIDGAGISVRQRKDTCIYCDTGENESRRKAEILEPWYTSKRAVIERGWKPLSNDLVSIPSRRLKIAVSVESAGVTPDRGGGGGGGAAANVAVTLAFCPAGI